MSDGLAAPVAQLRVRGSKRSALAGADPLPPAARTFPSGRKAATCSSRVAPIAPAELQLSASATGAATAVHSRATATASEVGVGRALIVVYGSLRRGCSGGSSELAHAT